jgi:antitoxin MazE
MAIARPKNVNLLKTLKALDICINNVYTGYGGLKMEAVIKKWGNSLGIRIPNVIVRNKTLKDGASVEIIDTDNGILISPKQRNILSEMLGKITMENIHSEIETGGVVGNEIW